jgi:hypothetical protein
VQAQGPDGRHPVRSYLSWSRGDFGPYSVIPDKSVGEDQELAHDRGDGELGRLSCTEAGAIGFRELQVVADL